MTIVTGTARATQTGTTTARPAIRILIPTIMTTDAAKLLRLQSWFSPAFPIGAFSYSHGLEWAVEDGAVTDRASLVAWLEADLRHGTGRMDAIFFAQGWRAGGGLVSAAPGNRDAAFASEPVPPLPTRPTVGTVSREGREPEFAVASPFSPSPQLCAAPFAASGTCPLPSRERAATPSRGEGPLAPHTAASQRSLNDVHVAAASSPPPDNLHEPRRHDLLAVAELAAAMRGTSELALESGQQGIAFLGAVRKAWPHPDLDRIARLLHDAAISPVLPVAAALCCAAHGIGLDLALPLYVHGAAANLVSAAVRLVPLGQTDGQIALAALEAAVLDTASDAASADADDIGSAAFMVDIASMRHETQYTRLFRS
jgi:urease accessory protein UreF